MDILTGILIGVFGSIAAIFLTFINAKRSAKNEFKTEILVQKIKNAEDFKERQKERNNINTGGKRKFLQKYWSSEN